jgi:exodeoxyribonuclease VII large subunit
MILLTVSQINAYLRDLLEADELLAEVWVEGEVSNLRRYKHYYFTLKDDTASLDAVMWQSNVKRLSAPLNDGDAVLAHGRVSIYETSGKLQLYADTIRPAGVGLLHARFEELKARLETEGLFDAGRKRPVPPLPRRIGVATSEQSAALRDILHVLKRRYPLAEVLLSPCMVQGEQAPASIVHALNILYGCDIDLIILARGGGSIEDLWSFNEEAVARAVFASPVPVITGVGHETDTTIVDYVADLRAPTPSAAAELAVPEMAGLAEAVADLRQRLDSAVGLHLDARRRMLDTQGGMLRRHHPMARIAQARQQVDDLLWRIGERTGRAVERHHMRLENLRGQLEMLSPFATLQRGYAVVRHAADNRVVTDFEQTSTDDELIIMLRNGQLRVRVISSDAPPSGSEEAENIEKTTSEGSNKP